MNYFSIYAKIEKVSDFYLLKSNTFALKVEVVGDNFDFFKSEYFISTFFNSINHQTKYFVFSKLEIKLLFDELMLVKGVGPKTTIMLINSCFSKKITTINPKIKKIINKYQFFLE